jgi:hypothetical protein
MIEVVLNPRVICKWIDPGKNGSTAECVTNQRRAGGQSKEQYRGVCS